MEPTYKSSSFYDKKCDLQNFYKRTERLTERTMKTEGLIIVTSPFAAFFTLDLEWFEYEIPLSEATRKGGG